MLTLQMYTVGSSTRFSTCTGMTLDKLKAESCKAGARRRRRLAAHCLDYLPPRFSLLGLTFCLNSLPGIQERRKQGF